MLFVARGISAGLYKLNDGMGKDWWQLAAVIMYFFYKYFIYSYFYSVTEMLLLSILDHTQTLQHYTLNTPFFCDFSNGLNNIYLTLHLVNQQNLLFKKLIIIWLTWTMHKKGNKNWPQFTPLNSSCHGVYSFKILFLHELQRNVLRTINLPSNWQIWMFPLKAN